MQTLILQGLTADELTQMIEKAVVKAIETPAQTKAGKDEPEFLTRNEVMEILNMKTTLLWKLTKQGVLKSYMIGGRVLYKKSEVLNSVKSINH